MIDHRPLATLPSPLPRRRAARTKTTDLTVLAIDQLEFLNALPFSDSRLAAGGDLDANATGYSITSAGGDPDAYLRWRVVDTTFALKQISLVVGTSGPAPGDGREVFFQTYRILAQ